MKRRFSICFVAPHALPALLQVASRAPAAGTRAVSGLGMGGSELQQVILARELSRRGHRVVMVVGKTSDPSAPLLCQVEGIELLACPAMLRRRGGGEEGALEKGWRLARQTTSLRRVIERAGTDLCLVRSNHLVGALVGGWCRLSGRPFVFASGHDGNCDLALAHRRPHRAVAYAFARALRGAAAVVVQTEAQRIAMRRHLGVRPEVIPNTVPLDRPAPDGPRHGVIWVGTIEPRKGADRLLQIAASLPGVSFTVVGGGGDHAAHAGEVARRAAGLANVRWLGPLPHARTLDLISRAALLLNTSRSEGFPNTFLEAWARGTPVVSLQIDPDGCHARRGLGLLTHTVEATRRAILQLLGDPRRRDELARVARAHVASQHGVTAVTDLWEALLGRIGARRGEPEALPAGVAGAA